MKTETTMSFKTPLSPLSKKILITTLIDEADLRREEAEELVSLLEHENENVKTRLEYDF